MLQLHSSHKAQSVERSLFEPLKAFSSSQCHKLVIKNPGRPVTVYQVAYVLKNAYVIVTKIGNAMTDLI
jgi:hypothetical protein